MLTTSPAGRAKHLRLVSGAGRRSAETEQNHNVHRLVPVRLPSLRAARHGEERLPAIAVLGANNTQARCRCAAAQPAADDQELEF
jgi:hypothetical protein